MHSLAGVEQKRETATLPVARFRLPAFCCRWRIAFCLPRKPETGNPQDGLPLLPVHPRLPTLLKTNSYYMLSFSKVSYCYF